MRRQLIFFLAVSAFCQGHSSDTERVSLFKQQMTPLLADMPSYSCLESMDERVITTTGRSVDVDLVRVEVAVSGRKEMYAWPTSTGFSDRSLASTLGNGFNTAGIFSNLARGLASLDYSQIEYQGEETLYDEPVLRYSFRFSPDAGPWQISSTSQDGMDIGKAGEDGIFWISRNDLILRKIDVAAIDIPRKLRLKNLHMEVNYELMSIGERRVLLPSSAVVKSSLKSDLDRESYIVFNHCHAFRAESTLSFVEVQQPHERERPGTKLGLPDGLNIPINLLMPIGSSSTDSSDVLEGTVAQTVRYRGAEIIRKGAEVEGHIFRHRTDGEFEIEIDRLHAVSGWMPVYARLVSMDGPVIISKQRDYLKSYIPTRTAIADIPTPGVATIRLTDQGEIPAGTAMIWSTESLTPRIQFLPSQQNCQMCFAPAPLQ